MAVNKKRSVPESGMMVMLPKLVVEILTWLPGKEVGRCKCVCKSWRSLINTCHFSDTYRSRNRCLMLYWLAPETEGSRLHFFYSPLRQLKDETEEFKQLHQVQVQNQVTQLVQVQNQVTQLVNGLICVVGTERMNMSDVRQQLTIHNVCTGESMNLKCPQLLPRDGLTVSRFYLGYDPKSRRYKLLRFIFRIQGKFNQIVQVNIMTLGPSTSELEWRKLDFGAAGICRFRWQALADEWKKTLRTFSGDGVLCWLSLSPNKEEGLVLFDLNHEKFRWVKLPAKLNRCSQKIIPRTQFKEQSLALSLWVGRGFGVNYYNAAECFVPEDDEGETWTRRYLSLPEELLKAEMGTVNGSFSDDNGIMVMSVKSRAVYCTNNMGERFWVGKIPTEVKRHNLSHSSFQLDNENPTFGSFENARFSFGGRLSYLVDSNDLYHSLDQVLSGRF